MLLSSFSKKENPFALSMPARFMNIFKTFSLQVDVLNKFEAKLLVGPNSFSKLKSEKEFLERHNFLSNNYTVSVFAKKTD